MAFPYKNPITAAVLSGSESVDRTSTFGTNFSVLQIGGYMEVYNLTDLDFSTYGSTGVIENTGNTIPIRLSIGATVNNLVLNSDNISSGRRRLGMLVYVYETDTVYQYTIPNYDTLWASLTGLTGFSAISQTDTQTTVNTRSQAGRDFINAWTGSTIEGQSGVTRENARWRIYYGSQIYITGGTYNQSESTISLNNSTGGTITISNVQPVEYVGINSIPSSKNINDWEENNKFQDAYIVIPPNLHGRNAVKVSASYGDVSSSTIAIYKLEMKDYNNSVSESRNWGHSANTRTSQYTFDTPMTLVSGYTLNLMYDISFLPDVNAEGYSATIEIE